ncbi:DUF4762 family protein [Yersinia aleksiciae]|uniref:DUF4762 family protein n=1 Tax=Yersinia aleksiciae TaxID=263819 RepID=UPI0011A6B12E|nr:DUF4762 family protein [Yersinia aleksiciae]
MKKMNLADANTIVGGGGIVCKDTFQLQANGTTATCMATTTCTDKHGKVTSTTSKPADFSNCM